MGRHGDQSGLHHLMANLIATYTPGANRSDFTGTMGLKFRYMGTTGLLVSALGRNAILGDTGTKVVYLSTDSGPSTLLSSASVDLTGSIPGTFYYASCAPFALVSGTNYLLWSPVVNGVVFHDFSGCSCAAADTLTGVYSTITGPPWASWSTFGASGMYVGVDLVYGPASGNASSFFFGA